jgi:hypothetical protein
MWFVPAVAIPADGQARIDWLFGWRRVLDDWVGKQPAGVAPGVPQGISTYDE